MVWTIQHHKEFSKNGIWSASRDMAAFMYNKCKAGESQEFFLKREDFDKHIVKTRGKPYNRSYFGKIVAQLDEKSEGRIVVLERFNGSYYKMLVRPISFSYENEKSKQESVTAENAGNSMFSKEHKKRLSEQQQQDISTIDQLLRSIGMVYSSSSLNKIWRMAGKSAGDSIEYVKDAIKYMLHSNDNRDEPIRKPHGWLMQCLKSGWHRDDESIFGGLGLPTYEGGLTLLAKSVNTIFYEAEGSIRTPISNPRNLIPIPY